MEKTWLRKSGAVIIKEVEFKDKHYIDLRFFYTDKKDGELKPSRKGISLSYREFTKLATFIKECKSDESFLKNLQLYKNEAVEEK